jgi:hypothetical protein
MNTLSDRDGLTQGENCRELDSGDEGKKRNGKGKPNGDENGGGDGNEAAEERFAYLSAT